MTEPLRHPRELCWRYWRHNPHTYREAGILLYCPGRARGASESPTHTLTRLFVDIAELGVNPGTWQLFYMMFDRERQDVINLEAGVWPEDPAGQIRLRRASAPSFVRLPAADWTPIPGLLRAQVICKLEWEVGDFILRHPKAWQGNLAASEIPPATVVKPTKNNGGKPV